MGGCPNISNAQRDMTIKHSRVTIDSHIMQAHNRAKRKQSGMTAQRSSDTLFSTLPYDLEEKIIYDTVLNIFHERDLDLRDIAEALDDCSGVGERIDVLVNWIDSQAYDEDWKDEVPLYVLDRCL